MTTQEQEKEQKFSPYVIRFIKIQDIPLEQIVPTQINHASLFPSEMMTLILHKKL